MVLRVTRSVMLMSMAQVAAMRGTCSKLQVGVVISKEGRILSTGYNGAPAGMPHCEHYTWERQAWEDAVYPPLWINEAMNTKAMEDYSPSEGDHFVREAGGKAFVLQRPASGCPISEHAERNAIAWAARNGVALEGAQLHCTHAPCLDCARSIINAGISCVSYVVPYRLTAGVELLERAGLQVIAMGDPGMVK